MDTLLAMLTLIGNLAAVWGPYLLGLITLVVVVRFLTKTVHTARANAQIREARRVREAYRAPVIDINTHRRRFSDAGQKPVA